MKIVLLELMWTLLELLLMRPSVMLELLSVFLELLPILLDLGEKSVGERDLAAIPATEKLETALVVV